MNSSVKKRFVVTIERNRERERESGFWIQKQWTKQDNLDAVSTRCVPSLTNPIPSSPWLFPISTSVELNTSLSQHPIPLLFNPKGHTLHSIYVLSDLDPTSDLISCVSPQILAWYHDPLRFHARSVLDMTPFSIVLVLTSECLLFLFGLKQFLLCCIHLTVLLREISYIRYLRTSWVVAIG